MAILTLRIPEVKTSCDSRPNQCRYCDSVLLQGWGRVGKTIRDPKVDRVTVQRYRCISCGRTFRHYPQGVSAQQQSERLVVLAALLWAMGLSLRSVTAVLGVMGIALSHETVWQDAVALGQQLRRRRRGRPARVLGVDGAAVRLAGQTRGVVVAVDPGTGRPVELLFADEQDVDAMAHWLAPLVEQLGVETLVTDDLGSYGPLSRRLHVDHQRCLFHLQRWARRALRLLRRQLGPEWVWLLDDVDRILDELSPRGGHELHRLWELVTAAAPLPGQQASPLYNLRHMLARLAQNWADYLLYTRLSNVPTTNNATENLIGRFKIRSRTTRGMKSELGVQTLFHLCATSFTA